MTQVSRISRSQQASRKRQLLCICRMQCQQRGRPLLDTLTYTHVHTHTPVLSAILRPAVDRMVDWSHLRSTASPLFFLLLPHFPSPALTLHLIKNGWPSCCISQHCLCNRAIVPHTYTHTPHLVPFVACNFIWHSPLCRMENNLIFIWLEKRYKRNATQRARYKELYKWKNT